MIPHRFVIEYPDRCLTMLKMLESPAREQQLVSSLSLLVASSIFLVPYERMKKAHPLRDLDDEPELYREIKRIEKQKFVASKKIWADTMPHDWRFSRIMTDASDSDNWQDEHDCHPMDSAAENTMYRRCNGEVLRVIRNALAHGNVVFLDRDGFENRDAEVHFLAFLSRYEETEEQRKKSETYRLVATTEESFLSFVKAWAKWLSQFEADKRLFAAAVA